MNKLPSYLSQYSNFNQQPKQITKDLYKQIPLKMNENNNDNFKVVARIRPPVEREIENGKFISTMQISQDQRKICLYEYQNTEFLDFSKIQEYLDDQDNYQTHQYTLDWIYDQASTQQEIYETTARQAVMSVLEGFNATIMAYGQTGTGKTYTMEGFKYNQQDEERGIVPRSTEEIFNHIESIDQRETIFIVRANYLQIYNENISDLLRNEKQNLQIREDKKKGVFVEGLSEWVVRNPNEIYRLIKKGSMTRATAETKLNNVSSRSHAIFQITIEQMTQKNQESKQIRVGKLNLVDLAGSERVRITGATGQRLEESKKINQSLSALGNVIMALTDIKQNRNHIPYRDSKITRILEDSLGGNCKTTFIATVSPSVQAFAESLSTIKFAHRAKQIKNTAVVNEDLDQRALLRKYESELQKLRHELEEKNKVLVDKQMVLQLEEEKRKAEKDKFEAQALLEVKSQEFYQERRQKELLEQKINSMNSQVLIGGRKIEDTPQFRSALQEHQNLIREQYEDKIQQLENERQTIQEDKLQVDRYKQLLLKQRDIMIALTTRLNERDENILILQEELDAYERINKEQEDIVTQKSNIIIQLKQIIQQKNINIPDKLQQQINYKHTRNDSVINRVYYDKGENQDLQKEINNLNTQLEHYKRNNSINQNDQQTINAQNDVMKSLKYQIDSIIKTLSQPNDHDKLQTVAKDLLQLQKTIEIHYSDLQSKDSTNKSIISNNTLSSYTNTKYRSPTNHQAKKDVQVRELIEKMQNQRKQNYK